MIIDESYSQGLSDILTVTEQFMESLDSLPLETAVELYDLLDDAAHFATSNIKEIDPELRVQICDRQDYLLERIVDELPSFEYSGNPLKIYMPAIAYDFVRWPNVCLMKDSGLIGYTLAKVINATPVMYFGTKPEDYPYLSILPEMEMLYDESEDSALDACLNHLKAHYAEMDVLIFYGMYTPFSNAFLSAYRSLRPDGRVYCALDMNTLWMSKISWESEVNRRFLEQCNIVATSSRNMRDILNRSPDKNFPCRWFPNGFYNPTDAKITADVSRKENIILTVGRIGTDQKNNEELLTGFARASNVLDGWTLRLVGPTDGFEQYIDFFFKERPDLKDRVIFTGPINDKEQLYNEYERAKVFALTSRVEGAPNVFAEALFHGCMFVTSDIDAALDITNYGQLGMIYKLYDLDALVNALINVCLKADRQGMQTHIPKALAYAEKYYDWNRNAKKLAYMLFSREPGGNFYGF